MKNYIIISVCFFSIFSYSQESVFNTLNNKGVGVFDVNAQLFFINQKTFHSPDNILELSNTINNATSMAFTLNYKSPKIKHFSVTLSYIQAMVLQEYSSLSVNAADVLQNGSFGILNNVSINYHLETIGFKEGIISVGRFALDTGFMTRNRLRQKNQAYEGVLIDIPDVGNWRITLGYLSKFSSWKSNPNEFKPISSAYISDIDKGQEFVEVSHSNKEANVSFGAYYISANNLWNIVGIYYLQKIITFGKDINLNIRGKSIFQWDNGTTTKGETIEGIQPGVLLNYRGLSLETGAFLVPQKTAKENTFLQNPFGAKLIVSEPLLGTNSSYNEGSESYYLESSYRFSKGNIYLLYLYTRDKLYIDDHLQNTPAIYNELDLIVSYNINKRWNTKIKAALLDKNISNKNNQIFDVRLVMSYNF
ncbi:hypothetical protein [Flavivirga jejuensis]|uniref:Outer membrane OprD family porin n=1 Tax=Flavivirga jejuensis TaxID=870487 RepID=A0ABT8WP52_9FLAO|nr:hypothetical protein [Flavivirga jejuensis]MDO5974931.1 hypothetical protein [Flavivirga jejuensis]